MFSCQTLKWVKSVQLLESKQCLKSKLLQKLSNQNVQNGLTQALIFHEDVWFNFMFFYQSTVDSTHDKRASVSLYKCPTHPIAKVISFFGRKPYRSDLVGSPNITYFVSVYLKSMIHDV